MRGSIPLWARNASNRSALINPDTTAANAGWAITSLGVAITTKCDDGGR